MKQKFSILYLENGTSGGGSFESLYQIVTGLDQNKFSPIVVFVNENHFMNRMKQKGIQVYLLEDFLYTKNKFKISRKIIYQIRKVLNRFVPSLNLIFEKICHMKTLQELEAIVRRHQVQLIHLNNQPIRDLYAVFLAKKLKIACISHIRSTRARMEECHPKVINFINENVQQFLANSDFTKNYWVKLGIARNKIQTFYNTLAPTTAVPALIHEAWHIPKGIRWVIGCVGNLFEVKGHSFLLKVFREVLRKEASIFLLIVGDGPLRTPLVDLTQEFQIAEHVIFTGYQPNAKEIIAAFDLLVLPSREESFGRALLEAMMVETPIVAARSGGIPEVIQHEDNGLLVDFGDVSGFCDAILRVLQSAKLQEVLKKNGRKRLEEQFSLAENMDILESIYLNKPKKQVKDENASFARV